MKYISIYLSTAPEDRGDKPPRYIINLKNLIKRYKGYEDKFKVVLLEIQEPSFFESDSGLPVHSVAIFLNLENGDYEIIKLPFRIVNRIMLGFKPYKKFINYLQSEFGKNLIVHYSKKHLKFYIVDTKSIYLMEENVNFIPPTIESGVYKTSVNPLSSPISRTVGGQNIESVLSENERRLVRYVSEKLEELIDRFKVDRFFIATTDEKSKNMVLNYVSRRVERLFKGHLKLNNENKNEIIQKLLKRIEEIDRDEELELFNDFKELLGRKMAVVGIESVIKHALMYNIKYLLVNFNFYHKGYICHSNGLFYHKELDFPCDDLEITDDIVDYLIDFVIENGGRIEIVNKNELNEIISDSVGAILRFNI